MPRVPTKFGVIVCRMRWHDALTASVWYVEPRTVLWISAFVVVVAIAVGVVVACFWLWLYATVTAK